MNNFGIILNQDNNQSYLGKFYNRNRLEFPVIRKIYEQIENNKTTEQSNNQNIVNEDKTILHLQETNINEYTNIINDKNLGDKIDIKLQYTNSELEDIIILDKTICESKINNELIDNNTSNNESQNKDINLKKISLVKNIIDSNLKNHKTNYYFNFNTKELLFLWLSSILVIYKIEFYLTKIFNN